MSFLLPVVTLWRREIVRFVRQRNRIVGALGTPLVFWLLIGSGLGSSFRSSDAQGEENYLEYSFPGTLALILLFTSIFSTISIIEDRQAGFLQSVVVAPVRRTAITLGKVLGGSTLALLQALVFLALAPTVGIHLNLEKLLILTAVLFLVAFGLSSLGYFIAWRMDSTQGFHAIMNLLLMPMWLLSGSFFPPSGAPVWLQWIIRVNPMTYGVAAVRRALYLEEFHGKADLPSFAVSIFATVIFSGLAFAATTHAARKS